MAEPPDGRATIIAAERSSLPALRSHKPTLAYVEQRLAQGRTKREIVRCLKRYVARKIFGHLCGNPGLSSRPTNTTRRT